MRLLVAHQRLPQLQIQRMRKEGTKLWRCLVVAVALCWITMYAWSPARDSPRRREGPAGRLPHILFVVLDDMGSHDLGMHGTGIHTPYMDKLVEEGVFLSNYYVLPACSPTRCALMSGRYPLHTGVNEIIMTGSTVGLPLDEQTLPEVLAKGGYQRHMVGKWHMGSARWEQLPTFRGFESFFGFVNGMEDYYTHSCAGGHDFRYDRRPKCGEGCSQVMDKRGRYSTHLYAEAAIDIIEKHNDEQGPLFLYLAFQAPHAPEVVPEEYERAYTNRSWTQYRKTYAGMLTCADEAIGNVTKALKARGMWDNTLVIGTTDNGGPTETCVVTAASNWPLRGGKCTLWEGGTRGDGFLSGPALERYQIARGVYRHLFHVVDWLPTLAEMVGVAPSGKPLDGVSQLRSLVSGNPARQEAYLGVIPWPGVLQQGMAAVYGNWKVIRGNPGAGGGWAGPDGSRMQRQLEIPPDVLAARPDQWPWLAAAHADRLPPRHPQPAVTLPADEEETEEEGEEAAGGERGRGAGEEGTGRRRLQGEEGGGDAGAEGGERGAGAGGVPELDAEVEEGIAANQRAEEQLEEAEAQLEEAMRRARPEGGGRSEAMPPQLGEQGWSRWALYDLSKDVEERFDLAASHPQELKRMQQLLAKYAASAVPQQREDPSCPWSPEDFVQVEGIGPVWAPWCKHSSEIGIFT